MFWGGKSIEPKRNRHTEVCVKLGVQSDKNQQTELVNGGGTNSNTDVLSKVTNILLSPCTLARSGIKNVGTFLLMLLMLQVSGFIYHQILAGFLHIQNYSL